MGRKMVKKLWFSLAITFIVGIFSLSVQPTEATSTGVSQQNSAENVNILIYAGICLIIILIALIIKYYKITGGENGNR